VTVVEIGLVEPYTSAATTALCWRQGSPWVRLSLGCTSGLPTKTSARILGTSAPTSENALYSHP
jgi:hypothetical protein